MVYVTTEAQVQGVNAFPREHRPTNIPLLYFAYHIMAGLGTIFIAVMSLAVLLLWRNKLFETRWLLWIIMLCLPFPYVANTAGWLTAAGGRQPSVGHGAIRDWGGT